MNNHKGVLAKTLGGVLVGAALLLVASTSHASPPDSRAALATIETYEGSDWLMTEGPTAPSATISPSDAVREAKASVRGFALGDGSAPDVVLVYLTQIDHSRDNVSLGAGALVHRLVWLVQQRNVTLAHSQPFKSAKPLLSVSTVQWAIDATDGHYLAARDFGMPVAS